jgi:N6-adenosine-specific RNA methylase IME4
MVVDNREDVILRGSSPYQIGGQTGHQPQEHIFSVKSMMAKSNMEGRLMMLQAYDISKFFDKEVLRDAMNTLYELKVDMKSYMTWFKLNKNTRIRVKTGVGYTDWSEEGSTIGQGTGQPG